MAFFKSDVVNLLTVNCLDKLIRKMFHDALLQQVMVIFFLIKASLNCVYFV